MAKGITAKQRAARKRNMAVARAAKKKKGSSHIRKKGEPFKFTVTGSRGGGSSRSVGRGFLRGIPI